MSKTFDEIVATLHLGPEFTVKNISHESWREYEHGGYCYRIYNPVVLIFRTNGTTHRVVDSDNISHCHPIPGNGCALRWFNGTDNSPVQF